MHDRAQAAWKVSIMSGDNEETRIVDDRRKLLTDAVDYGDGDIDAVMSILDSGCDVNITTSDGKFTALIHAACSNSPGAIRMAEFLIGRGADVNQMVMGRWNPVKMAATEGNPDMVRLLVAHGASMVDEKAEQPLIMMVSSYNETDTSKADRAGVIRLLSSLGLDVNEPGADISALAHAVRNEVTEQAEIINALIDCGADMEALIYGQTALEFAYVRGKAVAVETLLSRGAVISDRLNGGEPSIDDMISAERSRRSMLAESHDIGSGDKRKVFTL